MIKLAVLAILLVCVAWMWATLEQRSLYFPDTNLVATPAIYKLTFEDLVLKTANGAEVHGWFIPAKAGKADRTFLFSHGNAGNISHRLDKILTLHNAGYNVLIYDYRGYGISRGKPSEKVTYADASAAYRFLVDQKKIPTSQIVLYGESLGCAVAVELASKHPAGALILESPFTSTIAMGKLVFPWLPVQWMVRYRYDNLSKIPGIKMPLLILHSPTDEVVPFHMGQALYTAASVARPKKLVELRGGHNDGYQVSGPAYFQAIREFLVGVK